MKFINNGAVPLVMLAEKSATGTLTPFSVITTVISSKALPSSLSIQVAFMVCAPILSLFVVQL